VAQSFGGWPYARGGNPVKTEEDPLDTEPAANARETLAAIRYLEATVTGTRDLDGLALRYGGFYGPGTSLARKGGGDNLVGLVRKRRLPIVGAGTGYFSFCHIDDAASAALAAAERGAPGVYNVADDEPAPVREWLPALARTVGAKPPRRIPGWLARPLLGPQGMLIMTAAPGISNAKAKRELGWTPRWPSWRAGFSSGL
jgi:nucleoside-diphosphate-sugar epimerase